MLFNRSYSYINGSDKDTACSKSVVLDLIAKWTRDTPSEERVLLTVTKLFDVTISPAIEVQWLSSAGETWTALLKLFDRRCGNPRQSHWSTYPEHSPSVEACWQKCVQSGQAPGLFKYIEEMDNEEGEGVWDLSVFIDDENNVDTWETTAKKEGRYQYRAL